MAEYLTTDTDLTSVANAIRTKAGLSGTLEFPSDFVQAIMNIPTGGGASTVKAGEFIATSVGAMSIDTGYAGTGYPLAFVIIEMGGILPGTLVPGYSLYAKMRNDITPPSSYNFVYGFTIRCGSTGNEGQRSSSDTAIMYLQGSPVDNQNMCAFMSDAKTLRIYCGDTGTSFKTNKRYCYVVAYSDAG